MSTPTSIRLSEYSAAPIYNIKAVVQATGIRPSTLRAWERRYQMTQPQRSTSGYRLYSERDVAVIRWLKKQVDAGLAISQAVSWLEKHLLQGGDLLPSSLNDEMIALADTFDVATAERAKGVDEARTAARLRPISLENLRAELIGALVEYDEATADRVLFDAFSIYPVESIGEELVRPVLVEIGERWHRQELSVVQEHFASNFLLQRMASLLRGFRMEANGPVIWVGCAPGELHEGGALLLAIYLRRAGYVVRYLGQDIPIDDIVAEARRERPRMILLSASTSDGAEALAAMANALSEDAPALVGYGGAYYSGHADLRERTPGIWLGESASQAVRRVDELLVSHSSADDHRQESV